MEEVKLFKRENTVCPHYNKDHEAIKYPINWDYSIPVERWNDSCLEAQRRFEAWARSAYGTAYSGEQLLTSVLQEIATRSITGGFEE